jgi:hypothetical protein
MCGSRSGVCIQHGHAGSCGQGELEEGELEEGDSGHNKVSRGMDPLGQLCSSVWAAGIMGA